MSKTQTQWWGAMYSQRLGLFKGSTFKKKMGTQIF